MASNQNLVKRVFPWIGIFGHEGPAVIKAMCDLMVSVFEHIDITYKMDLDPNNTYN